MSCCEHLVLSLDHVSGLEHLSALKLWDQGTRLTVVARLVFNRLEIVENSASRPLLESVLNCPHNRGLVSPQLLLDRGVTFLNSSSCVGSGLFSLVGTRSVIYRP
jgi:hypothetical protein